MYRTFVKPVVWLAMIALTGAFLRAQSGPPLPQRFGDSIQVAFDGYESNPDGTLTLWFEYLNRNYEQAIDVPIGPDNMFEPGQIDRGQPTHFLPRRHMTMVSVVVPKDFGTLSWMLTANGKTSSAAARINRHTIIDRKQTSVVLSERPESPPNHAPVITLDPSGDRTARLGDPLVLNVSATDDGLPKIFPRPGATSPSEKDGGLTYEWSMYRGPAPMTFTSPKGVLEGKMRTEARFTQPGNYWLHVRVEDGSRVFGSYCCWTDGLVKVRVTSDK